MQGLTGYDVTDNTETLFLTLMAERVMKTPLMAEQDWDQ